MENEADICRVCRCEATADKPLFHPCVCTGSIKYIHQDCLVQWLKYTRKTYCELCRHQFKFRPIYRPDTPKIVPLRDIFSGIACSVGRCFRTWLHCYLVAFVWLGIVPLTSCRIYNFFLAQAPSALSSMYNLFRMENFLSDVIEGCVIVTAVLLLFIALVWLKDQVQSNAPEWLHNEGVAGADGDVANNAGENGDNNPDIRDVDDNDDDGDDDEDEDLHAVPAPDEEDHAQAPQVVPQMAPPVNNNNNNPAEGAANENQPAGAGNGVNAQHNNQNQGVWLLGGDEMTWDRVLGLDGSFVFLEHALWIITLNLMFILFFAFLPSHVGYHITVLLGVSSTFTQSQFQRPIETFCGYTFISAFLCLFYVLCPLFRLRRQTARVVGQMYLISKVLLLIVIEICVFPIACGWWLDILTLRLFGSTLSERVMAFSHSPWTSTLVHWTVGMIFVFYLASSFMLLRELLRPGVLWFLRNINDPEFNPIVEMIQFPVYRHVRRIAMSIVMFGCLSTLVIDWPVKMAAEMMPWLLPYRFPSTLPSSFPLHLLSQLFLLNLVLPALLDPGHTRLWAKTILNAWLHVFGNKMLGLDSYLFGSRLLGDQANNNQPNAQQNLANNAHQHNGNEQAPVGQLAELHQQMIDVQMRREQTDNEPFVKPPLFHIRVILLLVFAGISLFFTGLAMFALPVCLGRLTLQHFGGVDPEHIHDLYSVAVGLFIVYGFGRMLEFIGKQLQISWEDFSQRAKVVLTAGAKIGVILAMVLGVLPFLLGALVDVYILSAFRAPLLSTPIGENLHLWATGFVQVKLLAALVVLGPRNRVRDAIEAVAGMGGANIQLRHVFFDLFLPVVVIVGFLLSAPYVLVNSVVPALHLRIDIEAIVQRSVHFVILASSLLAFLIVFQVRQLRALYLRIKNDKYMVGHQLMNYDTSTKKYLQE